MLKKRFLEIIVILITFFSSKIYSVPIIEEPVVRLGSLKLAPYGAVFYIKEMAPSCGIRVEEHIYSNGAQIMAAMAAKQIDVSANTAEAAIAGRAERIPIYIVAGLARGGMRIIARPGMGIKNLQDLRGKKIGVKRDGTQELFLYTQLDQIGLLNNHILDKSIQIIDIPLSELNQALFDKKIDAMVQSEPGASQAMNQGGIALTTSYKTTSIADPVRVLVMTENFYQKQYVIAAKFMECFLRAMQTFIEKPDIAQRYIRQIMFKGLLNEADFHDATVNFAYDFQVDEKQIQTITDAMGKYGVANLSSLPLAAEWVKLDLLDKVKQKLTRETN